MNMRYLLTILISIFMLAGGPYQAANAANCNPKDKSELASLIKKHSPFRGHWKSVYKGKTYTGPINIRTTKHADILRVQSSGADKKLNEPGLVEVKYTSSRKLTFNKNGKFRLTLNADCKLSGTQAHRSGRVDIYLK